MSLVETKRSRFWFPVQSWFCSTGQRGRPRGRPTFTHPLSLQHPVCFFGVANAPLPKIHTYGRTDCILKGIRGCWSQESAQTHPAEMCKCLTAQAGRTEQRAGTAGPPFSGGCMRTGKGVSVVQAQGGAKPRVLWGGAKLGAQVCELTGTFAQMEMYKQYF